MKMADGMSDAISGLQKARDEQAHIVAKEQVKLAQLDQALASLRGELSVSVPRTDYTGMGIVEATERFLREVGEPKQTSEIAEALLTRGLETKSKRFVPTVYATLTNSTKFKREHVKLAGHEVGVWSLKGGSK